MNNHSSVGKQFKATVQKILVASGFVVNASASQSVDIVGDYGGKLWAIEVRFYRSAEFQGRLVKAAALEAANRAAQVSGARGVLVTSCFCPREVRNALETEFALTIADRADLLVWAMSRCPEAIDVIAGMTPDGESQEIAMKGRTLKKVFASTAPAEPRSSSTTKEGSELCSELRSLPSGKASYRDYEVLCVRILKFLFAEQLQGLRTQPATSDGSSRFDCVCRIQPMSEFWRFLMQHLDSRYVLFEFKNSGQELGQGPILTTEKYLFEKALRRVAVVFARKGAGVGARRMISGAMREHGKLILVLADSHVCKMLSMRDNGEDPADLLFEMTDEFLVALSR